MLKKLILILICLNIVALGISFLQRRTAPEMARRVVPISDMESAVTTTLQNRRTAFTVFEFPAKKNPPKALIFFWSGDGGWGAWEIDFSLAMQEAGYTVVGIDSAQYAVHDYDLTTLQADMRGIVRSELEAYRSYQVPVILGGWSMGAAQVVAAAGGPHPPPRLAGLILFAAMSRGRYGLTLADRLDVMPTGPGTFGLADFAPNLDGLRIVQWHAETDHDDSTTWLEKLRTPHREIDLPRAGHDYEGCSAAFLQKVIKSVDWIINPNTPL